MAVLSGQVELPDSNYTRYAAARFVPRGWPWVDPLKDMQATLLAINNGLASRTEALAEQGMDIDEVYETLQQEKKLAESYGLDFSAIDTTKPTTEMPTGDDEKTMTATASTPIIYNMAR